MAILETGHYWSQLFQKITDRFRLVTKKEEHNPSFVIPKVYQIARSFLDAHPVTSPMQAEGFTDPLSLCCANHLVHCDEASAIQKLLPTSLWENGARVRIDFALEYRGWCVDAARTFHYQNSQFQPCKDAEKIFFSGLQYARNGQKLAKIFKAWHESSRELGWQILPLFTGHAIGRAMHEEPRLVPHPALCVDLQLKSGMILALEFVAIRDPGPILTLDNGWTYMIQNSTDIIHYEETIVITHRSPLLVCSGINQTTNT